jgi:hypothetical protein
MLAAPARQPVTHFKSTLPVTRGSTIELNVLLMNLEKLLEVHFVLLHPG